MEFIRFRSAQTAPSVSTIREFRQLTNLGIADIRHRCAAGEPILEVPVFRGDWTTNRHRLAALAERMENDGLPLIASEIAAGEECSLTIEELKTRLRHLRSIELQTQMDVALETGEIDSPDDFTPYDEDWTP